MASTVRSFLLLVAMPGNPSDLPCGRMVRLQSWDDRLTLDRVSGVLDQDP